MKTRKLVKAAMLSILLVIALLIAVAYIALHETPEEQNAREALEKRAKTEVMMRMSPTADFDSISNHNSESFYTTLCGEQHGWIHQIGVMEAIDVTSPSPGRAYLNFCVNTDTWKIETDNDLAKNSTTDESAYLDAQGYCFKKTDKANRLRDRELIAVYGETFLSVRPSGTDILATDFSCTSYFSFPQRPNQELAIWRMFPNQPISDDYPMTVEASRIQIQLSSKGEMPPHLSPPEQDISSMSNGTNEANPRETSLPRAYGQTYLATDSMRPLSGQKAPQSAPSCAGSSADLEDSLSFISALQLAVRTHSSGILQHLVDSPLHIVVKSGGAPIDRVLNSIDFRQGWDGNIFNPSSTALILALEPPKCLVSNEYGFSLARGALAFHRAKSGELRLVAIEQ